MGRPKGSKNKVQGTVKTEEDDILDDEDFVEPIVEDDD